MTKVRSLSEYLLYRNFDVKKTERLHLLVGEFRKSFFQNHALQNLMLNRGYEPEKRPESFFDLRNGVFNRNFTIFHLDYLEQMVRLATTPQVIFVEGAKPIIVPGEPEQLVFRTAGRLDAAAVEEFQKQWFEQIDAREWINHYKQTLYDAFDEYNMQLILGFMDRTTRCVGQFDIHSDEERRLHKEIIDSLVPVSFLALDNGYYKLGTRFFRQAGEFWEKLNESEYGKMFILQQGELIEALKL